MKASVAVITGFKQSAQLNAESVGFQRYVNDVVLQTEISQLKDELLSSQNKVIDLLEQLNKK